jgi:Family of unknown function (DUF6152)
MKVKLLAILTAGVVLPMISGPMFAHHGGAQYDTKHPLTMSGTVTEYLFTNPHVQIHIDVAGENGGVEKWIAETASPQRLYGFGWNAKTLKAGDKVTVTGAPLKDGQKIVTIIKLTGGNAPVLTQGSTE